MSAITMAKSSNAIRIFGLSRTLHRDLTRAVQLAGFRSISQWLLRQTQNFIKEQKEIHGDLLTSLTPLEQDIVRVIEDGANDPDHIAQETMIPLKKLNRMLADLFDRGIINPPQHPATARAWASSSVFRSGPCDPDHRRFGQQCHTELRMHRVAHLVRQLEQRCGRAAPVMHQRERVRGRDADG